MKRKPRLGVTCGGGDEQVKSGFILKEEPIRFADRLDVGQERKRVNNDSKVLAFVI